MHWAGCEWSKIRSIKTCFVFKLVKLKSIICQQWKQSTNWSWYITVAQSRWADATQCWTDISTYQLNSKRMYISAIPKSKYPRIHMSEISIRKSHLKWPCECKSTMTDLNWLWVEADTRTSIYSICTLYIVLNSTKALKRHFSIASRTDEFIETIIYWVTIDPWQTWNNDESIKTDAIG